MGNRAKEIIIPNPGVFRTVFLYVGQGEAILMVVPDGQYFKYILIDTNNDVKNSGIDVEKLLNDLLDDGLDVFINTHPHNDHLKGIKKIHEAVSIKEVWHSGHKPGKEHNDAYQEMQSVINDIGQENEYILYGTNDVNTVRESDRETKIDRVLGDIEYIVLAPAYYVSDDIENEDPDERYKRIHEQCGVIKFSYGGDAQKHILITGDADKTAWEEHITNYHKEKLPSDVLSAVHHGSRTFFKENEDDEDVYEDHIEEIVPSHLVISAPKQPESPHGHPHDDAMDLYKKHLDDDSIYHLGKNRECVIVDITSDGNIEIKFDQELSKEYGFNSDDDGESTNNSSNKSNIKKSIFIASQTERIDRKPMG